MGPIIYVGNLGPAVTRIDLEGLFRPFGVVKNAHVMMDRGTGRSRGFGFVEMEADAEAGAAIAALHHHDHDGRRLTVNRASSG